MRVMVIIKANKESEAGVLPDEKILTEMGQFNEELVKAGVMLAGERGDLLAKLGRFEEARVELERAASLTRNARERTLLLGRAAACAEAARAC